LPSAVEMISLCDQTSMISETHPFLPEVGVVALVPDRWGPQWQARHHIVTRLARYFQVVWMENPRYWRTLFSGSGHASRSACKQPIPSSLHIYEPAAWLLEFGRPRWLARLISQGRLKRARNLLLRRGCKKIVLYIWRPQFADALNQFPHDLSCYQIDDEYSFSPVEVALNPVEVDLIRSVGQVFVHSQTMMERKGIFNPNTQLVPNGVDYWKYAVPLPEPQDLRPIPHPRIGYAGVLKPMLNWSLLVELSHRYPQWSFVLVGEVSPSLNTRGPLAELSSCPNVHMLGAKPTDSVPGYLQHIDVCMLPYRLDDYTKYIYPLKLHEYLASGTPVVGAPIPAIETFKDLIRVAHTADDWSRAIERALSPSENTRERCAARQRVAREHDWDLLVRKIARTLAQRLDLSFAEDTEAACQSSDSRVPVASPQSAG
jgi:glycosyltransferase involved in cell wall biosynthesis